MFHSNDNKDNKAKKYHRVTVDEAKANPEYWLLTQTIFREQAARVIQKRWRENHNKEFQGKPPGELLTTKPSGNRLRFLKEPLGKQASEHAAKIKQGAWLDLDFTEPEFSRNIYKACREGKITVNETATAILLHSAIEEVKGRIRQYRFNEQGPFDIRSIGYVGDEEIRIFNEKLSELPEHERCYFAVNFSRVYELGFLLLGVHLDRIQQSSEFRSLIIKKINKSIASEFDKKKLITLVNQSTMDDVQYEQINRDVIKFLLEKCYTAEEIKENETSKNNEGSSILVAGYLATPFLQLSPDYDESNPNSPLMCAIIPTVSTYNLLQLTAHKEEHAVIPFFTIGKIPIELIKNLIDTPEKFIKAKYSRPIELAHPDLVVNTADVHGGCIQAFSLAWHDLFYHAWIAGANIHKPFLFYLRELLVKEKKFTISKAIWDLIDMETKHSPHERKVRFDNVNNKIIVFAFALMLENIGGKNFFLELDQHDYNLLILIDMIINREIWKKFIGIYPEKLFKANIALWESNILGSISDYFDNFQSVFARMKSIIDDNPPDNFKNPTMFYILYYRLLGDQCGHAFMLCKSLDENFDLKNILTWYRNEGLYIRKSLTDLKERAIEKIEKNALAEELVDIAIKLEKTQLEEPAPQKGFSP